MGISLNDSRKVIESELPSITGSKVKFYDNLTIGELETVDGKNMDLAALVEVLKMLLIEWNLDEKITVENLKKLQVTDMNFIIEQTAFFKNAKKQLAEQEELLAEKKRNIQKPSTA